MVKCSAYKCKSASYRKTPGISFHRFPKDHNLKEIWVKNINRQGWSPTSSSVLCSKHFQPHMKDPSEFCTMLRHGAVPTLFEEYSERTSSKNYEGKKSGIMQELPDHETDSLDWTTTLKTWPADSVYQYMQRLHTLEPVKDIPAGTSYSMQPHNYSDQVNVRAVSMDHNYSRLHHCDTSNNVGDGPADRSPTTTAQVGKRTSFEEFKGMESPLIKQEPPDHETGSLDTASNVKTEPADVDNVFSQEEVAVVKEEIYIGPTVIQPSDNNVNLLNSSSTVKTESANVDDVYSLEGKTVFKEEGYIGPTVIQPLDDSVKLLDAASTVKMEPADTDDVYSLEEETVVKEDMEIGPTVIQPLDDNVNLFDSSSIVKTESANVHDVNSLEGKTIFKEEGYIGPTVIQSLDNNVKLLDAASTVKTEPTSADDVYSVEEVPIVKEEIYIGPTVIRPVDIQYVPRPCKLEPVEYTTSAGTSYSSYSTFSDQVNVRESSMDHKNSRLNHCNTCHKNFKYNRELNIHMRDCEPSGLPYNCEICNKRLKIACALKRQFMFRTGKKLYKYEKCNKAFKNNTALNQHARFHTGERPFKCEICNKCFKSRTNAMQHVKSHTDKCEICNYIFNTSNELKLHMLCHIGERQYNCEICNTRFQNRREIVEHIKSKHIYRK